MKRARGGSDACVQRTRQLRLARMHVEMAQAGSISHSLLFAFSVLKRSPGPTNHLCRLEHNDNAGSPLNGLGRRCGLLTLIAWYIFLPLPLPNLLIPSTPTNLTSPVSP